MVVRLIRTREGEYEVVKTIDEPEMVVIPKAEHERLLEREGWLECLEAAGVDNWDGCYEAARIQRESENDCE